MDLKKKTMIEKLADNTREHCLTQKYGIANIFNDCENMGYKLIRYPLESDGVLGFSQLREGEDKIIFSNSSSRLAREIFTVAHEIGHFALHISEKIPIIVDESLHDSSAKEQEANYFAACLLAPNYAISRYVANEMADDAVKWSALDISKMMIVFNISFETALNRLEATGFLTKKKRMHLETEKNTRTVTNLLSIIDNDCFLNKPALRKTVPSEFLEWVLSNFQDKIIPQETLNKALTYFDLLPGDVGIDLSEASNEESEDLDDLIRRLNE